MKLTVGKIEISLENPVVMAIVNVTPDSFFSGSRTQEADAIERRVRQAVSEGAAILDVGGYSSRPGADDVSSREEFRRLASALEIIRKKFPDTAVSIDTFRAGVMEKTLENFGPCIVNDITGAEAEPEIAGVAARYRVPFIAMHMRGTPQNMQSRTHYDDLIGEINATTAKGERTLVTTLTKKMAEDLTKYLTENGIRVRYMHSDIGAMERMEIIRDLRMAKFDVLIGINLLREGLDLPEVSLIAILDADKEGFLRSETSLIQTIGRAARNAEGRVLLYADKITPAMRAAMDETARRRQIQDAYNQEHGIVPKTIVKSVRDLIEISATPTPERKGKSGVKMTKQELQRQIEKLEKSMREAARMMEYEYAAVLRDEIIRLRGEANQAK